MGKPETFAGEKVLNRAVARFRTGVRKPFQFNGKTFELTNGVSEDGFLSVRVQTQSNSPPFSKWMQLRTLDASGLLEAINMFVISEVMES